MFCLTPAHERRGSGEVKESHSKMSGRAKLTTTDCRPDRSVRMLRSKGSSYAFRQVSGLVALLCVADETAANHP